MVAQAARPVRQAAQDQHGAGRRDRPRWSCRRTPAWAGWRPVASCPGCPPSAAAAGRGAVRAPVPGGPGRRAAETTSPRRCPAPGRRSGRKAGPTRTPARAVADRRPRRRFRSGWPARSWRCRRITRGCGLQVVDLRPPATSPGAGLSLSSRSFDSSIGICPLTSPTRKPFRASRSRSSGGNCCSSISSHSFSLTVRIAERDSGRRRCPAPRCRATFAPGHQRRLPLTGQRGVHTRRLPALLAASLSPTGCHGTRRKMRHRPIVPDWGRTE